MGWWVWSTLPDAHRRGNGIVWLASEESAAVSGHHVEVTNGMQVPAQSRSQLVSWPDKRLEDLTNNVVLILGGSMTIKKG
jgi:malonyl-CoA reductase/3-hydroxypropionate dehydrogenase (NADP+)